jgi:hypothetical protein
MKLVLGIDIGLSGALALLDNDGTLLSVEDMPCLKDGPALIGHQPGTGVRPCLFVQLSGQYSRARLTACLCYLIMGTVYANAPTLPLFPLKFAWHMRQFSETRGMPVATRR